MIFLALAVALGVGSFMAAAPASDSSQEMHGGTGIEEEDWGVRSQDPVHAAGERLAPEAGESRQGQSPRQYAESLAASTGNPEDAAAQAALRFDQNRLRENLLGSVDGTPVYGGTSAADKLGRLPLQEGRKYIVGSYVPAPAGNGADASAGDKLRQALMAVLKPFDGEFSGGVQADWTKRMADVWQSPLGERRRVTSRFGYRSFKTKEGKLIEGFHGGMDFAVPVGTPVYAARPGEVIGTGRQKRGGKYVVLRHAGGFTTRYCHLSRIDVREGQVIRTRIPLGLSGNTGLSTGPHLHFAVRKPGKGGAVNPATLISI